MARRKASSVVALLLAVAVLGDRRTAARSDPPAVAPSDNLHALAVSLVKELADERFAVRERASDQLIRLGPAAVSALQQGSEHADREVRYRSRRVLATIRQTDFQRRLEAFAADRSGGGHQLPGWDRFQKTCGGDAVARSLFVEMQRSEPELLLAVEQGPQAAGEMVGRRVEQLRESIIAFRQPLTLGSVAALLFAAGDEGVVMTDLAQQSLYGYCQHPAFSNALQNGTGKDLLRKMLGLWIRRGQGWGAYQGMILAAHYGLKDGLVAAQNVLRDGASPTVVRQIAIFAVAKLGDEGHLPLLERLLQDETVCAARRVDDVEFVTQIRDVALAALIHLTKLDPQDFGLVRTKLQGTFLVDAENVGFADEDKREQALQRWRQYRAQQKQRAVQR